LNFSFSIISFDPFAVEKQHLLKKLWSKLDLKESLSELISIVGSNFLFLKFINIQ